MASSSSSSATAPSSRTTRSSHTATAASSSMVRPNHVLREWSYPPVAPAIVLDVHDDSPQRESKIYTYPVATFVTNFVRHTVDHIYASVVDEQQQQQQQQQHQQLQHSLDEAATLLDSSHPSTPATAAAIPVSPDVPATSSSASSLRHHDHQATTDLSTTATTTARPILQHNNHHMDHHLQNHHSTTMDEFVLVDGDLVAIPAPPPNEVERDELEFQLRLEENSCQPKRIRRGVRGLRKWIRNRGRRQQQHQQQQDDVDGNDEQLQQQQPPQNAKLPPSHYQNGAAAATAAAAAGTSIATMTVATATTPPKRAPTLVTPPTISAATAAAAAAMPELVYQDSTSSSPSTFGRKDTSPTRRWTKRKGRPRRSWRRHDGRVVEDDSSSERGSTVTTTSGRSTNNNSNNSGNTLLAGIDEIPPRPMDMDPTQFLIQRLPTIHRASTVSAELIGNADQLLEAGVLTANVASAEVAYIEEYDQKKDEPVASVLPPDADYKVDKADAPCVDTMLRQAERETASDLEQSVVETSVLQVFPSTKPKGKSDGLSCPLSLATNADQDVHNDILKVIMVGAANVDKSSISWAIRQTAKKPKKRTTLGVDVHVWTPPHVGPDGRHVKFSIWDVQGSTVQDDGSANAGAHPGTQSLFFSPKSLYLLVWDLAVTNTKTIRRRKPTHAHAAAHRRRDNSNNNNDDDDDDEENLDQRDDDDDDDDDDENEFFIEEANRRADGALQSDIKDRVLSWVDCIARRGPNSAILPVALIPDGMDATEARRRCAMMQAMLGQHILQFERELTAPKIVMGTQDSVVCVKFADDTGVRELQDTIVAIATDVTHSVFDHVGTQVPTGTVQVLEVIRHLKTDHKVVLLDHLLAELSPSVSVDDAVDALIFLSSIGELLYFGGSNDEILSRYIILSRKWLVSALSCILRNDWKRELAETRRFMNMQCLYSNQEFPENEVCRTLMCGNNSSCPVLSSADSAMLWQTQSFMREAADRSAHLSEDSATTSTMFDFLEHLLVQSGLFVPIDVSDSTIRSSDDEVFFVPSLLVQADPVDVWTFKSSESWNTTLCDSWLFRDGAPLDLMEHLMVSLLRNLYKFSRKFPTVHSSTLRSDSPHRARTCPLRLSSMNEFMEDHDGSAIGRIRIHQIMCWKASIYIKIGCSFADAEAHEIRESFSEIFVTLVDQSSMHCVSADAMRSNMQRLVVSGKGQIGCHGRKLWKGGYAVVLKSINEMLCNFSNVDRQVVCPECLAHTNPSSASTWSWDSVQAAAGCGNSIIRCMRGHRVDSNLICGIPKRQEQLAKEDNLASQRLAKVGELLKSVVVVGLYDARQKKILSVGSGFIVDKKLGLIVTAGHVLFNMKEGRDFGTQYFGSKLARTVIGIIPDKGQNAVFRYYADVVAHDIHNIDACVLQIVSRMENDVADEVLCGVQAEIPLLNDHVALQQEDLQPLKLTRHFELEENVRVLGFNQGSEGLLVERENVNLTADFAKGYICKKFRSQVSDDSSSSSDSSRSNFAPREEIVIMCPTIGGHSGGPCVNDEGKVVGILSRADPAERQRCYLVPTSEVKLLVNKAKEICLSPMSNMYR